MNFGFIKTCLDLINRDSPIKFQLKQTDNESCEMFSDKENCVIIIGKCTEPLFYIYSYASKLLFREYFCQSIYAQHSMYDDALSLLKQADKGYTFFNRVCMKAQNLIKRKHLNNMTILAIFHEIGHIVFYNSESAMKSYFSGVKSILDSFNISKLLNLDDPLKKQIVKGYQMACKNEMNTTEEIACDFYAIDLIFKIKHICNFSSKEILEFCLLQIDLLTCTYQMELMNRTVHNDYDGIFNDLLAKYSIRRMVLFCRMSEVLSAEYNIDKEYFSKLCLKIAPRAKDLYEARLLCEDMAIKIRSRDWKVKNENKTQYVAYLYKFNRIFTSNYFKF